MKATTAAPIDRPAIVWHRAGGAPVEYGIWPERPVTIGRESTNTIVIESPFVSKTHAILQYRNGEYVLEDLGSANGTRLNGRPVEVAAVRVGDTIEFGDQRLVFVDRSAAPTGAEGGLSKGTKLMLVAGATAAVMIVGLGLLLSSITPQPSNQGSVSVERADPVAPSPSSLPKPVAVSTLIPDVTKRAERAGVKPADALYDEALVQFRVGRYKEARELLRAVVAMEPGNELAANRLRGVEGLLHQSISNYGGEAERAFAQLRYDAAIAGWEQVLLLTEPADPRYAAAQQGISRARARMVR